jgi:hypothetical protein
VILAYVGNFTAPYCTEVHVAKSLELEGHQVVRIQERPMMDWSAIPAKVHDRGAAMLLWTRTWDQDRDGCLAALTNLRADGVPSAFYHLDRWWGLEREYQIHSEPFFRCDVVFSPDGGNDERWAEAGVNHRWLPPGVFGPECEGGHVDRRFHHDVVFVGSHPYPHVEWEPYRTELLVTLRARFGDRLAIWPGRNPNGTPRRPIRNRDLTNLYTSAKVVVGDSCLIGNPTRYWSDRIPETMGRGGFLIHPEVEGLGEWYEDGRDLVTYPVGDFDQVVKLVEHYLDDDEGREAIRARGHALVMGRDTYQHRMRAVLETMAAEFDLSTKPARQTVRVSHPRSRSAATFELAEGDSDAVAVREVWQNDDYRLQGRDLRGATVVDVGANVGAFSVLIAKLGAKIVHAYEPHPDNMAALVANVDANGVSGRVRLYQAAVGVAGANTAMAGSGGGVFVAPAGNNAYGCPLAVGPTLT